MTTFLKIYAATTLFALTLWGLLKAAGADGEVLQIAYLFVFTIGGVFAIAAAAWEADK